VLAHGHHSSAVPSGTGSLVRWCPQHWSAGLFSAGGLARNRLSRRPARRRLVGWLFLTTSVGQRAVGGQKGVVFAIFGTFWPFCPAADPFDRAVEWFCRTVGPPNRKANWPDHTVGRPDRTAEWPDRMAQLVCRTVRLPDLTAESPNRMAGVPDRAAKFPDLTLGGV